MEPVHSATSFDYQPYTIIPVIASFDNAGHVKPIYVRLNGEACKVDSYYERYSFAGQIEFNCKVILEDQLIPLSLTFYMRECLWVVQG